MALRAVLLAVPHVVGSFGAGYWLDVASVWAEVAGRTRNACCVAVRTVVARWAWTHTGCCLAALGADETPKTVLYS